MTPSARIALLCFIALFAAACGSGTDSTSTTAEETEIAETVEADDETSGNPHGAGVAQAECPDIEWMVVEASGFSFSLPTNFMDQAFEGADSEIGNWIGPTGVEVSYDYGPFSETLIGDEIDYSGFPGYFDIRPRGVNEDRILIGVYFDSLIPATETADATHLNLFVTIDDPADENIGRCITSSIDWKIEPGAVPDAPPATQQLPEDPPALEDPS